MLRADSAEPLRGPTLKLRFGCNMPRFAGSFGVPGPRMPGANLVCVGLPPNRGMFLPGGPRLGRGPGGRRPGDSGWDNDGLIFRGLDARFGAAGLLNWEEDAVDAAWFVELCVPALRPLAAEGVEVLGGASRLIALLKGRKMPAPGMFVLK